MQHGIKQGQELWYSRGLYTWHTTVTLKSDGVCWLFTEDGIANEKKEDILYGVLGQASLKICVI